MNAENPRPIHIHTDELEAKIGNLLCIISELEGRLEPYCIPTIKSDGVEVSKEVKQSKFITRISSANYQLDQCHCRISNILDGLEL